MRDLRGDGVAVLFGSDGLRTQLLARLCVDRGVSVIVHDGQSAADLEAHFAGKDDGPCGIIVDATATPTAEALRWARGRELPVLALLDAPRGFEGTFGDGVEPDGWLDVHSDPDDFVAALRAGTGSLAPRRLSANAPVDRLTSREREVLVELLSGDSTAAIADRLGISDHTVRTHVHNVLGKLGVRSRAQAAVVALESGIPVPAQAVSA